MKHFDSGASHTNLGRLGFRGSQPDPTEADWLNKSAPESFSTLLAGGMFGTALVLVFVTLVAMLLYLALGGEELE